MLKTLSIALVAVMFCGLALAAPQAKTPQAKTKEEYKAYNDANAVTGGAAMEKAARHFAGKFPASELTVYLYSRALHEYQNENNPARILEMGRIVLALDPANVNALVLTATVLSDSLSAEDADRAKKVDEIREDCERAEKSISAGAAPAGATPEQVAAYNGTLQAMIHSALGIMELKLGNDAAAEKQLKAATLVENVQPDAFVWYHLALAMDHQKEYPEALAAVNQALRFVKSNPELQKLATGERDRLAKLSSAAPAQAPQPETGKAPR